MLFRLLALCTCLAAPAGVTANPYDNLARVELLPGWRVSEGEHMAGLRITLRDGWKTYWRAPGDAGIPPEFSFAGSDNVQAVKPQWPVPMVFNQGGYRSIGYRNSVVFPLSVTLADGGAPTRLSGQIEIGVCEEICLPVSLSFAADLPATGTREAAITAALIDRPLTGEEAAIGPVTCAIAPIPDGLQVTASFAENQPHPEEVIVIESGDDNVWVSQAAITREAGRVRAIVDMVHVTGGAFALDRSALRFTLLSPDRAVELRGCQADATP